MNTYDIVRELEAQRDRLDTAITSLQGSHKTRGRKKRHMSESARRKQSLAAKRRWRAAKRAGKKRW